MEKWEGPPLRKSLIFLVNGHVAFTLERRLAGKNVPNRMPLCYQAARATRSRDMKSASSPDLFMIFETKTECTKTLRCPLYCIICVKRIKIFPSTKLSKSKADESRINKRQPVQMSHHLKTSAVKIQIYLTAAEVIKPTSRKRPRPGMWSPSLKLANSYY